MWHKVKSSNIAKVKYRWGTMKIKFHSGGTYKYTSVPKEEYKRLVSATSVGKQFNMSVKGKYPFKKER